MKKVLLTFAVIFSLVGLQNVANAQSAAPKAKKAATSASPAKADIEKLISTYQDALNASDTEKVLALYTKTGVLMASGAPTAEGAEQVKGTYGYVFENYKYTLQFSIIEVVVNGNTAFARSTSKGSFVIKASGQTVEDENRELFVFEKENGQWKIARYMYNKTK